MESKCQKIDNLKQISHRYNNFLFDMDGVIVSFLYEYELI